MPATRRLFRSKAAAAFACATAAIVLPASVSMAADLTDAVLVMEPATADLQAVATPAAPAIDAAEMECLAKVVMHEAGNQPHDGQVAVAQTLLNRLQARRFGGSICEVANQRGQFFNTAAYDPDRQSDAWLSSSQVARAVLTGSEDQVAPGALFFCSAAARNSGFFRTRQRVASVGAHVFYR